MVAKPPQYPSFIFTVEMQNVQGNSLVTQTRAEQCRHTHNSTHSMT